MNLLPQPTLLGVPMSVRFGWFALG